MLFICVVGWYRQCDNIAYTTDVDMTTWITEYTPALLEEIKSPRNNLKLLYTRGKVRMGFVNYTVLTFNQALHART